MSDYQDHQDACRHRNLERMGRVLTLPEPASPDRQAAWQQVTRPVASALGWKGALHFRNLRRMVPATIGAAAVVAIGFWLVAGHTSTVTAATVFNELRAALAKSLTIEIAGIDFGNAQVSGRIVLERPGPSPQNDTQYAEVHVLMKADNPEWEDFDAVLVIAQTPTDAWHYCRGNGGSVGADSIPHMLLTKLLGKHATANERHRATPTEYLLSGQSWRNFVRQPLDHFGGMPLGLGFSTDGSPVYYRFSREQRNVVEQLLRFLLRLSDSASANEVIAALKSSAGNLQVVPSESGAHVLRATRFSRLGELEFTDPVVPDVSDLIKQSVSELLYDPVSKCSIGSSFHPPASLYDTGVQVVTDWGSLPYESPENLIAELESRAVSITVDKSDSRRWVISVIGYPFATSASDLEWLGAFVRGLRDSLVLDINYDETAHAVQHAEFRGIGQSDGRIMLDLGTVNLDPARLQSSYWTTPEARTPNQTSR